jgi:hypothetical protein
MAHALDKAVRQARRKSRTPADARCVDCGIDNPIVLHKDGEQWRCYECAKVRRGERPDEAHHILGKDVDPMTVDIPANLHRILSEAQLDVPEEIRGRSASNPLVWIIRLVCAIRDYGQAIVAFLTRCANWLARLLARLEAHFGANWATALDLPPLFG